MTHDYRWHAYYARGRRQLRLGIWRRRADRVCPEYRYITIGNFLW